MLITADENIPCLREAFGDIGEIRACPGRSLRREQLSETEILLVRSVTRVDESLLRDTPVRFVASATIGTDHVDLDYLQRRGIGFASSPGCNADAAAQYVLACVSLWAARQGRPLTGMRLGIVGCGEVGSRVQRLFEACGAICLINDPPRARREGGAGFVPIETMGECDVVSLHVPLTREGADRTWHLFDARRLRELAPGSLLVNAARGAVVDNRALDEVLQAKRIQAVLDCWEGEPWIDLALLSRCFLGTPHIAGYSLEGRLRGTEMIYRAVCRYLGAPERWSMAAALPPLARVLDVPPLGPEQALAAAILAVYDPARDDAALRRAARDSAHDMGPAFDRLRREYPLRREFAAYRLALADALTELGRQMSTLGFDLTES